MEALGSNPELLKFSLVLLSTVVSILLAVNGFFIRSLVKKIEESSVRSQTALSEISAMKKDVSDIPTMKTDIAVIKNTLEHKNELSAIYRKLGAT